MYQVGIDICGNCVTTNVCGGVLSFLHFGEPEPYFIKVKIFLKSGFKMNWSSYVSANSISFSSS